MNNSRFYNDIVCRGEATDFTVGSWLWVRL